MGKFVLLPYALLLLVVGAIGCAAKPSTEPILLKFTPVFGEPIAYEISVNLDKTAYGRKANENVSAVAVMTPIERLEDGYRMTITVHVNSHNLEELLAEHMIQKADAGKPLTVSDSFVFADEDGPSLYFPDVPVNAGDSWEAEGAFTFGDLLTLEPPIVRWRFTASGFTREADRTLAHIGLELLTGEAVVPFHFGQAGIRCNEDGTVSELEGDAAAKLQVGDRIVAHAHLVPPDQFRVFAQVHMASTFLDSLPAVKLRRTLTAAASPSHADPSRGCIRRAV